MTSYSSSQEGGAVPYKFFAVVYERVNGEVVGTIKDAKVNLYRGDELIATTKTDEEGEFWGEGIDPQEYRLVIESEALDAYDEFVITPEYEINPETGAMEFYANIFMDLDQLLPEVPPISPLEMPMVPSAAASSGSGLGAMGLFGAALATAIALGTDKTPVSPVRP